MAAESGGRPALRMRAPAKLNLFLHVLARRADGYHTLDSLVAFTEAGDDLAAGPAASLSLELAGPFAAALGGADDDNLVLRAARALATASGVGAPGAALRLTKNLPVASGIGGGSSDAAAAMRLLHALWGLEIDDASLARAGLALGADLPVCLHGRACLMGGIGEALRPVNPLPPCGVLLVNPGVPVPTGEVFRRCTPAGGGAVDFGGAFADAAALAAALMACRNDLEGPALAVAPVIADVLAALNRASGCRLARLSGSGATCFGLFDDAAAAEAAAAAIGGAYPDWWLCPTRLRDAPARPSSPGGG
jgi:4-diphosphocytidyl-2-C-methyl-D-erythritol kinase